MDNNHQRKGLTDMPDEILYDILSYLDNRSLQSVASTCLHLANVAAHPFSRATELDLIGDPEMLAWPPFDVCQRLRRLSLVDCDDNVMSECLSATYPQLTVFKITGWLTDQQTNLDAFIGRHSNIIDLTLIDNGRQDIFDYSHIALLTSLERLSINSYNDTMLSLYELEHLNYLSINDCRDVYQFNRFLLRAQRMEFTLRQIYIAYPNYDVMNFMCLIHLRALRTAKVKIVDEFNHSELSSLLTTLIMGVNHLRRIELNCLMNNCMGMPQFEAINRFCRDANIALIIYGQYDMNLFENEAHLKRFNRSVATNDYYGRIGRRKTVYLNLGRRTIQQA